MKLSKLPFFQHINWNPDKNELRRFAIAMLVGFAILGLAIALKNHAVTWRAGVLPLVGIGLAAAAFVPGLGRIAYLGVYLPSSFIGYFVSKIILSLVFALVFVPTGLLLRVFKKDPLRLRPAAPRARWTEHKHKPDSDRYYRQF
jgi:hypothetical protein